MAIVNILIPLYNADHFVADTIESVLSQTYHNWELLIIDDCSTDKSYEIAKTYTANHPRIRVIKNECNLGMLENWNKGISLCKSQYFVKLDADDLWEPTFLEKSLKILEDHPGVGLVFTKYVEINSKGEKIEGSDWELPEFAKDKSFSCIPLVKSGPLAFLQYPILRQGVSVMRRKIFDEIGSYRYLLSKETLASTDTEFYFRVGAHYKIFCIDENLYNYRIHRDSISRVNERDGLNEKKINEIRLSITNYYYQKGILTEEEYNYYVYEANKVYQPSIISNARKSKRYLNFLTLLMTGLLKYPSFMVKFYFSRIFTKNH